MHELAAEAEVPLCWAASSPQTGGHANLGDSLSAVVVAALADRPVRHVHFDASRTKLVAVGTIGDEIRNGTAVVWGTGVSAGRGILAANAPRTKYDVRAVRGPITAQQYRAVGIGVPDIYGDPAWLLPTIVTEEVEKHFELGVIPHLGEMSAARPEAPVRSGLLSYALDRAEAVTLISTWHKPTWQGLLSKLRLIRSCRRIVSRSFHGIVVAEAYGIPVLPLSHPVGDTDGLRWVTLDHAGKEDERVWEFYATGRRVSYPVWGQHLTRRTDWEAVMRAVDLGWSPHAYDVEPLVSAFPLPPVYDPTRDLVPSLGHVEQLAF